MNCSWFREHVQAFAIGALDAGDRLLAEQHLGQVVAHDGCFETLAEAYETVEMLDLALVPVTPARDVWSRIDAATEVATIRPDRPAAERQGSEGLLWGVALAAGVAIAFLSMRNADLEQDVLVAERLRTQFSELESARAECIGALDRIQSASRDSTEVLALLQHPSTRVVAFEPQGAAMQRGSAVVSAEAGRAFVVSAALPPLAGRDYQLWVIRGAGAPEPAGFVKVKPDGVAVGEFDAKLLAQGAAAALAVSIEPKGGSTTPTEVILVAKVS